MIFSFKPFQFDCQTEILTKNGRVFQLNEKPTRLLKCLLLERDKVHSKTELLESVWPDRVVTDQVVFQNISYLRSLFGNEAIKTFPKKGYKWHLKVEEIDGVEHLEDRQKVTEETSELAESIEVIETNSDIEKVETNQIWFSKVGLISMTVVVLALLTALIMYEPENKEVQLTSDEATANLVILPFSGRFIEQSTSEKILRSQALVSPLLESESVILSNENSNLDFFNSPFIIRKAIVDAPETLVMSGFLFPRRYAQAEEKAKQLYLLEYLVQGQFRNWQGYLLAENVSELTDQLQTIVDVLLSSSFFNLPLDAFATSELSILHNKQPENLDILKHLIERLIAESSFDEASARIEQLLQLSLTQHHPLYKAYASWFKGQVMFKLNLLELAKEQLLLARELMADAKMLGLKSEINKTLADVALINESFHQVKEYLFQSASEARIANRPVQEIRAYTLLSIYAAKSGLEAEKYEYLNQAKTLLADYKLDDSHLMLPFYHLALFAKTDDNKEHFYKILLDKTITPKNVWVFYSGSRQLGEMYIKQKRWEEALGIAEQINEIGRASALKAEIYRAQDDLENAKRFARTAFNSARTQKIDWLGLDMALLLLENPDEQLDNASKLLYQRYIEQTAHARWLETHHQRLSKVGIETDPNDGYTVLR